MTSVHSALGRLRQEIVEGQLELEMCLSYESIGPALLDWTKRCSPLPPKTALKCLSSFNKVKIAPLVSLAHSRSSAITHGIRLQTDLQELCSHSLLEKF